MTHMSGQIRYSDEFKIDAVIAFGAKGVLRAAGEKPRIAANTNFKASFPSP